MRHSHITGRAALAVLAFSVPALLAAPTASAQVVPEIGIGVGHLSLSNLDGGGTSRPSIELRVAAPFNAVWSVEGMVTVGREHKYDGVTTAGTFGVLFRRHFNATGSFSSFVTIGAVGSYENTTTPGWSFSSMSPPWLADVGAGARQRLGPRLSVQESLDALFLLMYPAGLRATVTLSMRIGNEPG